MCATGGNLSTQNEEGLGKALRLTSLPQAASMGGGGKPGGEGGADREGGREGAGRGPGREGEDPGVWE